MTQLRAQKQAALQLLADGRFPAGGYAHSGGLEPAVLAGHVSNVAELETFLVGRAETAGFVAAVFAAAACSYAGRDDFSALSALEPELDARLPSSELRRVSRQLGRQLLRAMRTIHPHPACTTLRSVLGPAPHQPVVMGVAAAALARTMERLDRLARAAAVHAEDVQVDAGSTLVLTEISAMLALPGSDGGRSMPRIRVRVEEGATLVWLPKPVIAARGCDHIQDMRINLGAGARLLIGEETILGRHLEVSGDFRAMLRISYEDRPLYHQDLRVGPEAEGSRSAAVLGDHRAVGSVIAVDPAWAKTPLAGSALHRDAILTALSGPRYAHQCRGPRQPAVASTPGCQAGRAGCTLATRDRRVAFRCEQ